MMNLKKKLHDSQLVLGSWITIGNSIIAEIMAKSDFDWLAVDMEHSVITLHDAQQLIQIIELSDVAPLVRVSENNPTLIKRVMDAGAHGVIVPMINRKDEAEQVVRSVKYPPNGLRGVGRMRRSWAHREFFILRVSRDWFISGPDTLELRNRNCLIF
jgi:2-dehydro-3-deoxyglucarate aldolase